MQMPFVLIVEDERDIAGYHTELALNGQAALERLATGQPDIVLLDLSLPRTSGGTVLRTMKNDPRLKHVPVIVITGHSAMSDTLPVEPELVMHKPVSPEQLIALVDRVRPKVNREMTTPLKRAPWDEASGTYTRSFFERRLEAAVRSMQENGQTLFAVLGVRPGCYDSLRARQGEAGADQFLREFAMTIKSCIRPTDTLSRFDGERFFILVEQAPRLDIPSMIASRLEQKLQAYGAGNGAGPLPYSIGVLLCDAQYKSAGAIVRDADAALKRATSAGAETCMVFDRKALRGDATASTDN